MNILLIFPAHTHTTTEANKRSQTPTHFSRCFEITVPSIMLAFLVCYSLVSYLFFLPHPPLSLSFFRARIFCYSKLSEVNSTLCSMYCNKCKWKGARLPIGKMNLSFAIARHTVACVFVLCEMCAQTEQKNKNICVANDGIKIGFVWRPINRIERLLQHTNPKRHFTEKFGWHNSTISLCVCVGWLALNVIESRIKILAKFCCCCCWHHPSTTSSFVVVDICPSIIMRRPIILSMFVPLNFRCVIVIIGHISLFVHYCFPDTSTIINHFQLNFNPCIFIFT